MMHSYSQKSLKSKRTIKSKEKCKKGAKDEGKPIKYSKIDLSVAAQYKY
jgi:hypothetical protein